MRWKDLAFPENFSWLTFSGRISVGEWWTRTFLRIFLEWFFGFLYRAIREQSTTSFSYQNWAASYAHLSVLLRDTWFVALAIVSLILVWIQLAANAKRYHDIGKSGWIVLWPIPIFLVEVAIAYAIWALRLKGFDFMFRLGNLLLIPLLVLLVLLVAPGLVPNNRKSNKYGPPPKVNEIMGQDA